MISFFLGAFVGVLALRFMFPRLDSAIWGSPVDRGTLLCVGIDLMFLGFGFLLSEPFLIGAYSTLLLHDAWLWQRNLQEETAR